jgi:steroid delta-isomerase-like uncharacterized protein
MAAGRAGAMLGVMTTTTHNASIVKQCYADALRGDRAALEQILTPDYVVHQPEDHVGVDGLLGMVQIFRTAMPDMDVTVDHQFADGDYVATRFTVRGTHDGELFGAAPTNRQVVVSGITLSRCENGRIAEEWELVDAAGLLQQIGLLPEVAPA